MTSMPHLPGYYYDSAKNRYFKGKPPKPPPSPTPSSSKHISLPRLLHETALGQPTTQACLHATLLQPKTPSAEPITLIPCISQISYTSSDTLPYKVPSSNAIAVLAFPNKSLTGYRYCSVYPPLSLASYDKTVTYATCDGVYLHQIIDERWIRRKYQLSTMSTVALSEKYLLMAGDTAKLYRLTNSIAPHPPAVYLPLRSILSCDLVNTATFALGTRDGRVQLRDHVHLKATFYPSGKHRAVTSIRIRDNLIWCSTMRGGTNLSAWDTRDLKRPAIVCKGHFNLCKMVGMDAQGSLVIAGGDDEKVRVWDIRGGPVLNEIAVQGIVKKVKMVGWAGGLPGACGVWLDTGHDVYARVVAR